MESFYLQYFPKAHGMFGLNKTWHKYVGTGMPVDELLKRELITHNIWTDIDFFISIKFKKF